MSPINPQDYKYGVLGSRLGGQINQESARDTVRSEKVERDYVPVVVRLESDTWIEGLLALPPTRDGFRPRAFDVLDRTTERLMRLVDAKIRADGRIYPIKAVAINKDRVEFMFEGTLDPSEE